MIKRVSRVFLPILFAVSMAGCSVSAGISEPKPFTRNETFTLDEISSADISVSAGGVTIKTGSGYSLNIQSTDGYPGISYSVTGGVLTVSETESKATLTNDNCAVELTVPADAVLAGVKAKSDMGAVNVSGISSDSLTLVTNMGEVSVSGVSCSGSIDLRSDMGSVNASGIKDLSEASIDIEVDMGEIKVEGKTVDSPYKRDGDGTGIVIRANMGSVSLS